MTKIKELTTQVRSLNARLATTWNMARVLPDQGGFSFNYYVDDHGEEHVHVKWLERGVEAKLNLTAGLPLEIKNDKFPDNKVTEAREILQHKQNRKELNKNIMKARNNFLAGNPHLMYDQTLGKIVPKPK
jgi:hypothetical protein